MTRTRLLDRVERIGNRLPEPLSLFLGLAALVVVLSALLAGHAVVHPGTGEEIVIRSLLERELLRDVVFVGAVGNFTGFAPLGLVLVAMIGIGIAERAGLIGAALTLFLSGVRPRALGYGVVLAGVLSSVALDAGYVVVVPLGALLFARAGRHPIAGLAAGFAGVSGGFSANLVVTSVDAFLAGLTTEAARVFDPAYDVHAAANLFFMVVSVPLLTVVGGWVTDRIVEPRLGTWSGEQGEPGIRDELGAAEVGRTERLGLAAAATVFVLVAAGTAGLTIPQDAVLRDDAGTLLPFYRSLVPLVLVAFALPGIAFGTVTGRIRSDRDAARMGGETLAAMGPYILLAFAMGQFVEYFRASHMGTALAVTGAEVLRDAGLVGMPLVLGFLLVVALVNLVIGSASAKWSVMGPIFVPMLMALGYSPELVQATYRVGDSVTNIVTPLMPYFPIAVAFARRYDRTVGLGTLISVMLPYSIALALAWTGLLAVWIGLGVPLGPDGPLTYPD